MLKFSIPNFEVLEVEVIVELSSRETICLNALNTNFFPASKMMGSVRASGLLQLLRFIAIHMARI